MMLEFLAKAGRGGCDDGKLAMTDIMLKTTPILEGWGNSNMPRNPDSSRFGKLYKIFFDRRERTITGCDIEPYMLEKSRVTAQQYSERNFHIFYRLVSGPEGNMEPHGERKWNKDLPAAPYDKKKFYLDERKRVADKYDFAYLDGGTLMREVHTVHED